MRVEKSSDIPSAWRSCRALTIFMLAVGTLWAVDLAVSPQKSEALPIALVSLLIGFFQWGFLLWIRKRSAHWIPLISIGLVINVVVTVLLNHSLYLKLHIDLWYPYSGLKITALALALTAPAPIWATGLCFSILAFAPAIQFFFFWGPLERRELGFQEPWITIGFILCSTIIWLHRLKAQKLAVIEAKVSTRAEGMERFAALLLSARHLANTPLQIIDANIKLLSLDHPDPRLQKIEQALDSVQQVTRLLAFGEGKISWQDVEIPSTIEDFEKAVLEFNEEGNPRRS